MTNAGYQQPVRFRFPALMPQHHHQIKLEPGFTNPGGARRFIHRRIQARSQQLLSVFERAFAQFNARVSIHCQYLRTGVAGFPRQLGGYTVGFPGLAKITCCAQGAGTNQLGYKLALGRKFLCLQSAVGNSQSVINTAFSTEDKGSQSINATEQLWMIALIQITDQHTGLSELTADGVYPAINDLQTGAPFQQTGGQRPTETKQRRCILTNQQCFGPLRGNADRFVKVAAQQRVTQGLRELVTLTEPATGPECTLPRAIERRRLQPVVQQRIETEPAPPARQWAKRYSRFRSSGRPERMVATGICQGQEEFVRYDLHFRHDPQGALLARREMDQYSITEETFNTESFLDRQPGFGGRLKLSLVKTQRRNPAFCQGVKMLNGDGGELVTADCSLEKLEGFRTGQFQRFCAYPVETAFQFVGVGLERQRFPRHQHQGQPVGRVGCQLLQQGNGGRIGDGSDVVDDQNTVSFPGVPVGIR